MRKILDHLDRIVRPALRDYLAAERALNAAYDSKDPAAIDAARGDVILDSTWGDIGGQYCCYAQTAFLTVR